MQKKMSPDKTTITHLAGASPYWLWAGRLLAGGCFFLILLKLYALRGRIEPLHFRSAEFVWMGLLVFVGGMANCLPARTWGNLLECLSDKALDFFELIHLYAKSNLAKYLPGNVMHYVSRSVIAKKYAIPLQATALASLLDALISALTALLLVGLALYRDILPLVLPVKEWLGIAGGVFLIALGICFPAFKKMGLWKTISTGRSRGTNFWGAVGRDIVLYSVYYLLTSCIFYILLFWVAGDTWRAQLFDIAFFRKIAGLYTLAWLIGFLIPGSPGGLGIREAMLLILLRDFFPQEIILMSAFLSRILSILSEILNYFLAEVLLRRRLFLCRK